MNKKITNKPGIFVDLDGTLARHEHYMGATFIGEPLESMVKRVKRWLAEGKRVVIFTARAASLDPSSKFAIPAINEWVIKHIGQELEITAEKDYTAVQIWDDRAIQMLPNTGLRADGRDDDAF